MQHCKVLKNSDPVRARSVRVPEIPFYDGYITFSDLRDHMEVFCAPILPFPERVSVAEASKPADDPTDPLTGT
mgnify:CR=1 FL=1